MTSLNSILSSLSEGYFFILNSDCQVICDKSGMLSSQELFSERVAQEDHERLHAYLVRLLKNADSGIFQFRMLSSKHSKVWVQFFWEVTQLENELALVGIGHPINSLDDETVRLIGSDAAYSDAENIAQMGSWWVNPKDSSNRWSLGNYKLWGADPTKPPPSLKWLFSKMHPDDASTVFAAIKEVEKGKPSGPVRFRMRLEEGHEYRHFLTRIKPWFIDKELAEVKGINLEITDLIRYQESLERQNQILEKRNETLSEYLFINSHEVRGSLSNILSIIELVKSGDTDTEEVIRLLGLASTKLDQTLGKINQILSKSDN